MSIEVTCDDCKASFRVRDHLGGKRGKCPKCGGVIEVPFLARRMPDRPATRPSRPIASGKVAKQALPDGGKPQRRVTTSDLAAAFKGSVPPAELSVGYRVGIAIISVVMIALPLLYVALIGLIGYLMYYHAVYNVGILQMGPGRSWIGVLLLYVGPLIMGVILILFMIKPIFSRSEHEFRTRSLTQKSDPMLFFFIQRLCEAVRAPVPTRIEVDCQVNAAAGFRAGLWSLFGHNDLVLVIGVPLVAGLTLRQFAGVLAHEFGHFSQGTSMRLGYVVRYINFWFARVVYERDQWDARLVDWASEGHIVTIALFQMTRLFVWLTRKVLWVLMHIGHGVSSMMSRQMELDADRQEARLAGSDVFEATAIRLAELNLAHQGAEADLGFFFQEGRLADNLPKLIMHNAPQIPKKVLAELHKSLEQSSTGLFDTHPCHKERVENAKRENAPGIFHLDGPAALLFGDFDALSKAVTWDFYRAIFGSQFKPTDMHPTDDLLARAKQEDAAIDALNRFSLGGYRPLRLLHLRNIMVDAPDKPRKAVDRLRELRSQIQSTKAAFDNAWDLFDKADDRLCDANAARALLDAKYRLAPGEFKTSMSSPEEIAEVRRNAIAEIKRLEPQLAAFETAVGERLTTALGLLYVPQVAARLKHADQWQRECSRVFPILVEIEKQLGALNELREHLGPLACLVSPLADGAEDESRIAVTRRYMRSTYTRVEQLRRALHSVRYPLDHVDRNMTVGLYALETMPDAEDVGAIFDAAESLLGNIPPLRIRLLARLAALAEQVETVLGFKPFPKPIEKPMPVEKKDEEKPTSEL